MVNVKPSNSKIRYVSNGISIKGVEVEPEDTFRFDCLRCGTCCSSPPGVNPKEASRIAQYLGMGKKDFFRQYLTLHADDSYGWKAKVDKRGAECAFYSKEKGKASCKIDAVKPRQCRSKPISRIGSKLGDGLHGMELILEPCRGFGRGSETTVREWVRKNRLEEAWKEEIGYVYKFMMMGLGMPARQLKEKIEELYTE